MNDTVAITERLEAAYGEQKSPSLIRGLLWPTVLLVMSLGACLWVRLHGLAANWPAMSAIVATSVAALLFQGGTMWRSHWIRRLEAKDEECRRAVRGLQYKVSESRTNEQQLEGRITELQERATSLAQTNTQLQAELDQLKRAEKASTQQRQVLESSKTVLELNVRERTKELQKLQRRYEMILNSAGEGICGMDIEGRTTFANPAVARITGWSLAELIGKTEQEIFSSNGTHTDSSTQCHPGERLFYRRDGSCFPVEMVKTSINENDQVVGSVLVFKDITERKRIEDAIAQKATELARSNSELEQFAFVASHDLQEPLRKIQAFGDRLKTKCQPVLGDDAKDYLDRMQNAAARMRTLIDDLLAFSRVIRRSEPFVEVDLGVLTKEVLGDLEVRIEKTRARIEVGELPIIEADPMQIRQLMLNLLTNALKFQPAGAQPVIHVFSRNISTVTGEQLVEITVQDNGIGFEEKYLEKIFAVFQRLHGRTEYEGTGVGLAVCRRITERHHGSITAKSQLGQGASFIVTLPTSQPKPIMVN